MTEADLPILGRRRIEAKRVKPIREGMAARRGKEQVREMLGRRDGDGNAGGNAAAGPLQQDSLPAWRDVPGHGSQPHRAPALLQPRQRLL